MNGINGFQMYQYNYIPNLSGRNAALSKPLSNTMPNGNAGVTSSGRTNTGAGQDGVILTLSFGSGAEEDGKVIPLGDDAGKANRTKGQKENFDLPGSKDEKNPFEEEECESCKNRKYQDGSDENVSFKSAQHISPESAAARVRAHEGEHVANAYSKAAKEGGEVVRASVSIHTDICDECGKVYVSGGTTHTTIKYPKEQMQQQEQEKQAKA